MRVREGEVRQRAGDLADDGDASRFSRPLAAVAAASVTIGAIVRGVSSMIAMLASPTTSVITCVSPSLPSRSNRRGKKFPLPSCTPNSFGA